MSRWRLFYHFVWGTKNREPMIVGQRSEIIRESIIAVSREFESLIHGIGFMPEHVHLLISIPPKFALSEVMFRAKGASSREVNLATKDALGHFGWQREYGVLTLAERSLAEVKQYVENQPDRHARNQIWTDFERTEAANLN